MKRTEKSTSKSYAIMRTMPKERAVQSRLDLMPSN
jgi:hypothetical protein